MKKKYISLKLHLTFETDGKCITWIGSDDSGYKDEYGHDLDQKLLNKIPRKNLLLIHYLAKLYEGKNSFDELAIVNSLKTK